MTYIGGKGPDLYDTLNEAVLCVGDLENSLNKTVVKGWKKEIDKMYKSLDVIQKHMDTVLKRREKARNRRTAPVRRPQRNRRTREPEEPFIDPDSIEFLPDEEEIPTMPMIMRSMDEQFQDILIYLAEYLEKSTSKQFNTDLFEDIIIEVGNLKLKTNEALQKVKSYINDLKDNYQPIELKRFNVVVKAIEEVSSRIFNDVIHHAELAIDGWKNQKRDVFNAGAEGLLSIYRAIRKGEISLMYANIIDRELRLSLIHI